MPRKNNFALDCSLNVMAAISLVVAFSVVAMAFGWAECKLTWFSTDIEAKYALPSGCMVKTDAGHWVPDAKFRAVD